MNITYEADALKALKSIPKKDAKKLMDAIEQIAQSWPQRMSFATEMQGMTGYWRARKGNYRAIYLQSEGALTVIAIGKRGEIYR